MESLTSFDQFAKGLPKAVVMTNNCVIYTRVSTKEQADSNMSLDTQKKACDLYAQKKGYYIAGHFGGTYESAKNDERKEFKKMLSFVKQQKQRISYIIVYSTDRFSRSGANAIWIAAQLKKENLYVYAVTQPTDSSTASGSLQQNIQFIFSEYDNQLRKEKCVAGIKEKLSRGEWPNHAPMGFDHIKINGKTEIVVNEKGKLLRKAFMWKLNEPGITNEEIIKRLAAEGLKITSERTGDMFRNPFYCGLLTHSLLEGKIVEGKHEQLISKEVFLKINEIYRTNRARPNFRDDRHPLKTFLRCGLCGRTMRGYNSSKWKHLAYYKCNSYGCKCNRNAAELHTAFDKMLHYLSLSEKYKEPIRLELEASISQLYQNKLESITAIEQSIAESEKKIKRIRERFALEEIDREMYTEFLAKFTKERQEFQSEYAKLDFEWSKSEQYIKAALDYAMNLPDKWASGDFDTRRTIQNVVFPQGIIYNKETGRCRSEKINPIFEHIACAAKELEGTPSNSSNASMESFGWDIASLSEAISLKLGIASSCLLVMTTPQRIFLTQTYFSLLLINILNDLY